MGEAREALERHYRNFKAKRIQQQRGFYSLNHCHFSSNLPNCPSTAWVKIFDGDKDAEFHREESMLLHLNVVSPALAVPQHLHRVVADKPRRFFLFMTCFDSVLAQAIQDRAARSQYWSDTEVLYQIARLADTVSALHQMRIIHRNITPDSVFLKENQVYLGHFDDSKQISRGVDGELQTLRGCEVYLSPKVYAASKSQDRSHYSDAMKDDVWGVGVVLLAMAALKKPENLSSFFNRPQQDFNSHITQILSGQCPNLLPIITSLLTLNDTQRPDIFRVCCALRKVLKPCTQCLQPTLAWKWPCGHTICENCFGQYVRDRVKRDDVALCCRVCNQLLPGDYYVERAADLLTFPYPVNCMNAGCSVKHWSFTFDSNSHPLPRLITCQCGYSYCSFCANPRGHSAGRCAAFTSILLPPF